MLKITRIREYENLHIFLWLIKDTCWVMTWKIAGMFMIIPTIVVAAHITWIRRKIRTDLFHNIAICLWISGNSIWMTGEFFYNDTTRGISVVLFAIGLACVLYYYLIEIPQSAGLSKGKRSEEQHV